MKHITFSDNTYIRDTFFKVEGGNLAISYYTNNLEYHNFCS